MGLQAEMISNTQALNMAGGGPLTFEEWGLPQRLKNIQTMLLQYL